ncbi:hypothetical protein M1247_29585 [Mycobacterium sp. 21AC1]|uniref:hypothetical protein n=1 Tax=[Mycobacterium] appelbergii TaxID=2939269 RepID=UPI002938DCA1|nr:hypothetical protein [Mycobacterium sp. 21AC1]MDV3129090.1 hypothetical protein [Mycobacterium sp. 21AC1]
MTDYQPPELAVDRIARIWAAAFPPPEVEEPSEEAEPEPLGKGNVVPSAGNSPGELTADQKKSLLRSNKSNNELLAELLDNQNTSYLWYGPQR